MYHCDVLQATGNSGAPCNASISMLTLRDPPGLLPATATRHIAMRHLGLSHDDVYIQAGEARSSTINGFQWNNRSVCGEVGKALEPC
jgi:hypothetical protein